jgi:glycosyltransferase involved in cell wall biosynthesis
LKLARSSHNTQVHAGSQRTNISTALVTVIIPTHHRPALLGRAIASAVAQTHAALEILVVDDGPSAEAEAATRAAGDPRVRYLRHEVTRGAPAARNTGLREAKGEFVAFLDDDDTWMPDKLEKQLARFAGRGPDLGVVYCSSVKFSDITQRVISESRAKPLRAGHVDFFRRTLFGTSVPLIRRSCFDDVGGFDETLPGAQDRDMWIRLAARYAFDLVAETLVRHHIHGDQITANLDAKVRARELLLVKYGPQMDAHPDIMARYLWRLGLLCLADRHGAKGRRYLLRAVWREPALKGAWLDLARSIVTPASHRRYLFEEVFRGADGVPFYY